MRELANILIPVVATIGAFAVIIVLLILRGKKHQALHAERLAAIEKGLPVPPELLSDTARLTPDACLLRGLIWLLVGVATAIFFAAMAVFDGDREMYGGSTIGLVPIGVGIAYLVCYRKLNRRTVSPTDSAIS